MTGFWVTIGISAYSIAIIVGSFAALRMVWNKIARIYPAQPVEEEAISRSYQSCSIGYFNLGWSVRITVDSSHLHLAPNLFLLCASRTSMSIPWETITLEKHSLFKRYRVFRTVDFKWKFQAPAWALELAEVEKPSEETDAGN